MPPEPIAHLELDRDRSFVRFVFPFALKEGWPGERRWWRGRGGGMLARALARFSESGEWERSSPMRNPQVLPHIRELLRPDPESPVDCEYLLALGLSNDARQRRFPGRGALHLALPAAAGEGRIRFEVRDVELLLFRIGVGLLVLELRVLSGADGDAGPTPADLAVFNHYFRRVNAEQKLPRILGLPTIDEDASGPAGDAQLEAVATRDLLRLLLAPLGREGEHWTALAGDRLVPFTFALLRRLGDPGDPAAAGEIARLLFWLRRGYDLGYEPAPSDCAEEGNLEVLPSFRDVVVGGSSEGAAILASEGADPFLREGLPARARNTYFPLFLLAFQQRLAAIHFASAIAAVSRGVSGRGPGGQPSQRSIRDLRDRLFDAIVRGWYAEVGHEPQHAAAYALWQRAFRVEGLFAEVKTEIEELDEYLHRLESERQAAVLNILTLVVTPLVLAVGFWGMNFSQIDGVSIWEPWVWITNALFYAGYLGLAGLVRWLWRR